MTNPSRIDTPSQRWARSMGACRSGRARLGRLSLAQYFNSPKAEPWDLYYLARHFTVPVVPEENTVSRYMTAIDKAFFGIKNVGISRRKARKALLGVMELFDAHFPAGCL